MRLYSNKKSTINIAYNLVRQDQMKHIEIDKHFIKKKLGSGFYLLPTCKHTHKRFKQYKVLSKCIQTENGKHPFTNLKGSVKE